MYTGTAHSDHAQCRGCLYEAIGPKTWGQWPLARGGIIPDQEIGSVQPEAADCTPPPRSRYQAPAEAPGGLLVHPTSWMPWYSPVVASVKWAANGGMPASRT